MQFKWEKKKRKENFFKRGRKKKKDSWSPRNAYQA